MPKDSGGMVNAAIHVGRLNVTPTNCTGQARIFPALACGEEEDKDDKLSRAHVCTNTQGSSVTSKILVRQLSQARIWPLQEMNMNAKSPRPRRRLLDTPRRSDFVASRSVGLREEHILVPSWSLRALRPVPCHVKPSFRSMCLKASNHCGEPVIAAQIWRVFSGFGDVALLPIERNEA
ncbi:hypothetical protein N5P37_009698 [Trichoderma harzianum]|nr:hypothetical protein N5P37_009698 [Trichoderma harzianum]